jgi:hypothetical protein
VLIYVVGLAYALCWCVCGGGGVVRELGLHNIYSVRALKI